MLDFQRRVIYDLKRQYGRPVDVVNQVVSAPDLKSGTRNTSQAAYTVLSAIVLSPKFFTKGFYGTALLKAGRQFSYGGFQDVKTKIVILDFMDLPVGFEVDLSQHFIIDGERYEIDFFEELEQDAGFIVNCKKLSGVMNEAIYQPVVFQKLQITQSVSYTLN